MGKTPTVKRSDSVVAQKTASDERRTQLRKAQQRSRQRKLDTLNEARQQAEELQAKLTSTVKVIAELLETVDDATRAKLEALQKLLCTPSGLASSNSTCVSGSPVSSYGPHSSISNVSSESYDYGMSSNSSENVPLAPIAETTVFGYTSEFCSAVSPRGPALDTSGFNFDDLNSFDVLAQTPVDRLGLGQDNISFDDYFAPTSPEPMALAIQPKDLPETQDYSHFLGSLMPALSMPSLSHLEQSFAKRLYRRAWEGVYDMLTLSTDPKQIEAAFGNTLGYMSPSHILGVCTSILQTDKFDPLEFFTRPLFQLPRRSMEQQHLAATVQSSVPLRSYDPEAETRNIIRRTRVEDPVMTSMDVEKYLVESNVLEVTTSEMGERITKPTVFELSGRSWQVDCERLIQGLISVAVCVGRSPSFAAADVSRMLFQSMRPVYT